jgi:hypothetical protein
VEPIGARHGGPGASAAKWLIVVLLAVIAACLLMEVRAGVGSAQAQNVGLAKGAGVMAVAGQVTRDTYGIFLIDLENRRIGVYQWLSDNRSLRLMASRNYTFDLKLDEYNTEPSPRAIKDIVDKARPIDSPATRP